MNDLVILILNWNCSRDTISCLNSLSRQSDEKFDIYVIDNDSSDDSIDTISEYIEKSKNKKIKLLKNKINSGYSGGNNFGIKYALKNNYKYIGILNPDVILYENWVEELMKCFKKDTKIGVVSGLITNLEATKIQSSGDYYTIWGIPFSRDNSVKLKNLKNESGYIFGTSGAAFIAKAKIFKTVGMFDEKFFMYFEDTDLSFRLQIAGYKIYFNKNAICKHKLSVSSDKINGLITYNTFKNLPLLFIKNVPFLLWFKILPRFFISYNLIFINALLKTNRLYAIKGYLNAIFLVPRAFYYHFKIHLNAKVNYHYINDIIYQKIPDQQIKLKKLFRQ